MARRHLFLASVGLAALVAAGAAGAGQFSISPLRLDFSAATTTAALTVRNDDASPVVVQGEGWAWSQPDGHDDLAPSRDVLVSPAVFTLPPGGSQLVRIALRRPPDAALELPYRLTLRQVPQPAAPGFTGLQVALQLSVPIFVAPGAPALSALSWTARRDNLGRLVVVAHNAGLAHARIRRFVLKDATGTTLHEQPGLAYVLPGASRPWAFDEHNNVSPEQARANESGRNGTVPPARFRLEGTTDAGDFATELTLAAD
jgi:fimbrial chaperone protein